MREQRQHPRFDCTGTAEIHRSEIGFSSPARVENLSVQGCRLVLLDTTEISLRGGFELTFSVNQLPFRVRGEVKAAHGPGCFGVEFVQLSPRSKRYLQDLIEELAERERIRGRVLIEGEVRRHQQST